MTEHDDTWRDEMRAGWSHFGRAAEHFARRVARDARHFARNMEGHVNEFAHDVRREWHCGAAWRERYGSGSPEDVRRVFEDVRGVLKAVLEGVDDLVSDVFSTPRDEPWTKVVANQEARCEGCRRTVAAGAEAFVRRRAGRREFRCLDCGAHMGETRST